MLIVLIAIATGAFVLTRRFAASNAARRLHDAAVWYNSGRSALTAGRHGDAVASLRRAVRLDPGNREVALTLASALAVDRQDDAARQQLLALREARPEDPQVNLQLARLEARSGDVFAATRYYHGAIDAVWRIDQSEARRTVRRELIDLLLEHGDKERALSETLMLTPDLSDDAASRVEAGQLFLKSGDSRRAEDLFLLALRRDPANAAARAGAGLAAFRRGDYTRARRYLSAAADDSADVTEARTLTGLVLANDPLAPRLSPRERRERLARVLARAAERLASCEITVHDPGMFAELHRQLAELSPLSGASRLLDAGDVEERTELAARIAAATERACPPPAPIDRAVILIGRAHGLGEQGS